MVYIRVPYLNGTKFDSKQSIEINRLKENIHQKMIFNTLYCWSSCEYAIHIFELIKDIK